MNKPAPRETLTWPDWALDILESFYALEGGASVRARLAQRGLRVSEYSVRHKASRLDLSADMQEFTPAAEVARKAGVSVQAVHDWLDHRHYRRHCEVRRGSLHLPAPAVRLYLHERRVAVRPPGWWGSARTADHLDVSLMTLARIRRAGHLIYVQRGALIYHDPHSVREYQGGRRPAPPSNVQVTALASVAGVSPQAVDKALRKAGASLSLHIRPGLPPASYTTADHARAFLSARGHHEEMVETLLRRALMQPVRGTDADEEGRPE